jgi:hypothetical protein
MSKSKLLGSAATEAQIVELLGRFFYSAHIQLRPHSGDSFEVLNVNGPIAGVVVKVVKGRWRCELTQKESV